MPDIISTPIRFSIIVYLNNRVKVVQATIQSVLAQTYPEFELIVVDDDSFDGSEHAARRWCSKDPRVSVYYKQSSGPSDTRNFGIEKAKYEWLLFLNADEDLFPNALSYFVELIGRYPKQRLFVGRHFVTDRVRPPRRILNETLSTAHLSRTPYFDFWRAKFLPFLPSALFHRSLIDRFGMFNRKITILEDYDFILRMMQFGSVVYTPVHISIYYTFFTRKVFHHIVMQEMMYQVPRMKIHGLWWHALVYKMLELGCSQWEDDEIVVKYYRSLQNAYFIGPYRFLDNLRQKMFDIIWR